MVHPVHGVQSQSAVDAAQAFDKCTCILCAVAYKSIAPLKYYLVPISHGILFVMSDQALVADHITH